MTPEPPSDSPDDRKHYGARSALTALLKENFFQTERTPHDARTRWAELTGVKLKSGQMCVAVNSAFKKGFLDRASEAKWGHTYVTGSVWKQRDDT